MTATLCTVKPVYKGYSKEPVYKGHSKEPENVAV
jgi:hypothetical protein